MKKICLIMMLICMIMVSCKPDGNDGKPQEHEYVDLGLSVKWATCNVGANKPEDYGNYYAWGEVEPKEVYSWSTYFDTTEGGTTFLKYNNESGKTTIVNAIRNLINYQGSITVLGNDISNKEIIIMLYTSNYGLWVRFIYEKFGFLNQGVRKNFYDQPREDGIIYTLYLGENK